MTAEATLPRTFGRRRISAASHPGASAICERFGISPTQPLLFEGDRIAIVQEDPYGVHRIAFALRLADVEHHLARALTAGNGVPGRVRVFDLAGPRELAITLAITLTVTDKEDCDVP